ncbi:MAG: tripartite tricarboxylate transporter substrate binding protein [Alphaproteobacteria bacterium]|nr:MAG: tripartite tricarboxylate transporter substrate binding protein [Alphaproteobacteria bacterium]
MLTRRSILSLVAAAPAATAVAPVALAASPLFPTRPIRMIVASAAGGNADVVARLLANALEPTLGQRVVVENVAAASGMRATEAAARAAPDGYTWLVGTSSQLVHNIALFEPLPVDITTALRGVAMINEAPGVLVVKADHPARDLADFIARAKAQPGQMVIGSGPAGTTTHIMGLHFAQRTGTSFEHLSYPAGSQAMRDIVGGRVTAMFDIAVTAIPQITGGAVRGLAVSSPQRLEPLPGVPTMVEAGVSGFVTGTWNSIAVPTATPDEVVAQINRAVTAVVQAPEMRSRLERLGSFVPPAMSPREVDAYYTRERDVWIPIVRATGARQQG